MTRKKGVKIGSPVALPLAEVMLEMLERKVERKGLNRCNMVRYVNDCVLALGWRRENFGGMDGSIQTLGDAD